MAEEKEGDYTPFFLCITFVVLYYKLLYLYNTSVSFSVSLRVVRNGHPLYLKTAYK